MANRLSKIQTFTQSAQWLHVRSKDDSADALSRGQMPREFLQNRMWIFGPEWLRLDEQKCLTLSVPAIHEIPEMKAAQCFIVNPDASDNFVQIFNKFNCYTRLRRFVACCRYRFTQNNFNTN